MKKSLPIAFLSLALTQGCMTLSDERVYQLPDVPPNDQAYSVVGYVAFQNESVSIFSSSELSRLSANDRCFHLTNLSDFFRRDEIHGKLVNAKVKRVENPFEGTIISLTCVEDSVKIISIELVN